VVGAIDISTIAICVLAVLATGTDIAFGRIFNWLTAGMALLALVYAGYAHGLSGVGSSLLGMLAGLALYGWMFFFRVLGGGDVKLLMAFGAWGGAHYALDVAIVGVGLGGVMAIFWLAFKGKIIGFARRAYRFFRSLLIKELEVEKFELDRATTMPFGIPISIAAVWVQLAAPLEHWGIFK
jgi:prepilin peptidase CpaA